MRPGYVWENTTSSATYTINGGTGLCVSFETPTFSFEANSCTEFKGYICQKVEPPVLIQSSSYTSSIYTTSDRSTVLYSRNC
nr:hypothetical protein BgiMline_021498 [Biomphalaria glabrata]